VEEWVSVEYVAQLMEWPVIELVVKMLMNLHMAMKHGGEGVTSISSHMEWVLVTKTGLKQIKWI
jgi:hypothetical protein